MKIFKPKPYELAKEERDRGGGRGAASRDLAVRDVTFVKGVKRPPWKKRPAISQANTS